MKKTLTTLAILIAGTCFMHAQEKPTVYMVSNAHWDTQWNWDIQRSINEFLPNTLLQNFKLMETYPEYIFNLEGAVKYDMAKEYMPELYEQLRAYVKAGRWHVSGSGWDANDPNIPSIESNIRNYLYGQQFYKDEFGVKSTDVMLPDCFGFNYTMPTVASHCGLIGFGTQKLKWREKPFYENGDKIPFPFGIWEGIDGSRIMAAMDGGGYGWNPDEDIRAIEDLEKRISEASIPAVYRYFGTRSSGKHGDQGGSPLPVAVETIDQARQNPLAYNVRFASSDQMYKDYYMDPRLPVFKGELLMDVHATGCYTSHTEIKKLNRRIEWLLSSAEALGVLAERLGVMEYPSWTFDQIWKRILVHQFHDDITGTSIPDAYKFTYNDYYLSINQLENIIDAQLQAIGKVLGTKLSGTPLLVYNPVSAESRDYVTAEMDLPAKYKSVAVYDQNGRKVASQLLSRKGDKASIAFCAKLPSLSVSVFELRPQTATDAAGKVKVGSNWIENSVYKVTLNADGDICSIIDKRVGRELVKQGEAISLCVFSDNYSIRWPAWEIRKEVMDREPSKVKGQTVISCEYCGPVKAALRVERKYGESSFVQRIVLSNGAADDRIDIENDIDWQSRGSLLKASFPLAFDCSEASYDQGLGNVRRGNNTDIQYEVIAHQWADMTANDGSYGVTIMNDCKYGWDKPSDNTLRLTLLHTPLAEKFHGYQKSMDIGRHSFTYSIMGHSGELDPARADIESDKLNQRAIAATAVKGARGARQISLLASSNPAVRVKAVKKAIDGKGYIIRGYEQSGKGAEAQISFISTISSASASNGIEEDTAAASFSGNTLTVEAKPFSLNTFRILCDEGSQAAPAYAGLELPYNEVGISTDSFSAFGHVDKEWHSYAAELLPQTLSFRGVPYSFGRADFKNVVLCDGQKIALPEGTKTVHLLVASTTGEKTVTFNAGKDIDALVGNFSGFYRYNAWADIHEAVQHEGNVAYVGTHRHSAYTRNEAYVHTYMFYLDIPVSAGSTELTLPADKDIVVFSATAE